ncbi:D-alanyl-lipoteichoic acid biosynthesis protein DltD [Veillonellaceae bacterium WCA-693-APC-5D-A]|uniref:D-alanyl-lipoteichoic acid biosynthesis protein DltD n=1 Tax=Anaerovibrio slackiae TaxID=2652309 RepID=A0A6I2UIT2_9FIRM|nr:D-alanyl-lipoteichoic acid biosynthesis protein DltD [Anaerovibrio slackiae]MSU09639.1 D-alanyl-lipoteichoic acid biosynthesis protein DltD [Anaerovibrio slackiae]
MHHYRKIYKCLNIIGIVVIAVAVILCSCTMWLDWELAILDDKHVNLDSNIRKDSGMYLLQRSLKKGDLLLIGSSELSAPVEQNPINLYPNNELPANINKIGHAYQQCLLDGIMLGALRKDDSVNKIALIVSPQWFEGSDIDKKGFQSNFSELQFLTFLRNDCIADTSKKYVCGRLYELLDDDKANGESRFLSLIYKDKTVVNDVLKLIFYPYYELKYRLLVLKDKYRAYRFLKDTEETSTVKYINWDEAMKKASLQGEEACTNNNLFVYDEYYTKYIANRLDSLANISKNEELLNSREIDDFNFLLEMSNTSVIKPYFVFMSTNGLYYDYRGLDRVKRIALYDYLQKETDKWGIPYLDLREYEYEPYFYCDVMHLGWKGWTLVNEKISKHFRQI